VLGTRRRKGDHQGTMQTPGIPDLYVFVPGWSDLWIEVKSATGKRSSAQLAFAEMCSKLSITYLCGGLDEVIQWLNIRGLVR
jgi:hypothetical protein